jgi:pyridinium-3,5-bisthiocarboxylic acid mononucleotide nickel chelatase
MDVLTTLYFDCASGAAGDMILGALIDAGVALDDVRAALGSLAIAPDTVWTQRVTRAGISATKFCVRGEDAAPHDHDHQVRHRRHSGAHDGDPNGAAQEGSDVESRAAVPGTGTASAVARLAGSAGDASTEGHAHHDGHRTLAEIYALIDGSALSATGRSRARQLFERLAAAEAAIHGTTLDRVHLHEVGSLDSIIDIVGTVFAMEALRVDRVVASPLNVGGGTVRCEHGTYPVPAPATLRLLNGAPVYGGRPAMELVTPTGALLITGYASEFGPLPAMRPRRIGYGAGSRDFTDMANVVRAVIGDTDAAAAAHVVVVIEAEIDDMNPQIFGVLMDRLLAEGALDVFYTAIQMKKNRPGTLLTVVAPPALRAPLTAIVFQESTTIGLRFREMQRECLDRETVVIDTPLGPVRFKVARRDGTVMNASPEFDDCVRLASEHRRPVKEVQALAFKIFLER